MKIITDRKWKHLLYFYQLTKSEKARLDWIDYEFAPVFRYRGNVFSLDEFMRTTGIPELSEWHGYASDTYFSGVIIKISPDGERYMIGRYYA